MSPVAHLFSSRVIGAKTTDSRRDCRLVTLAILETRADSGSVAATNAAFAEHLARIQTRVPKGFTVVVQPPFVVIGDESPEKVRRRATNTVK